MNFTPQALEKICYSNIVVYNLLVLGANHVALILIANIFAAT